MMTDDKKCLGCGAGQVAEQWPGFPEYACGTIGESCTSECLLRQLAVAKPYMDAVRAAHNGYTSDFPTPESPVAAIQELIAEANAMGISAGKLETNEGFAKLRGAAWDAFGVMHLACSCPDHPSEGTCLACRCTSNLRSALKITEAEAARSESDD